MENENDINDDIELSLKSGEWAVDEAKRLMTEYNNCPTAYGKRRLLPKLESIIKKMEYEKKIVGAMMDNE